MILGEHALKRRLDLGLTQKALARRLGLSPFTILNWETGQTRPALRHIPAIHALLDGDPVGIGSGNLAGRMRARRTALGLSQAGLAKRLGLDPGTIRQVERGGSPRNRRVRAVLAGWLRKTPRRKPPA